MSVAARVKARQAALLAAVAQTAIAAAPAPSKPARAPKPAKPAQPAEEVFKGVRPASPAQRHALRVMAETRAANDNTISDEDVGIYGPQLAMLADHRRQLKDTQSVERKIDLKREFLPHYAAWTDAVLKAGVNPDHTARVVENEILATVLVWTIDAGDWLRALELADFVLANGVTLPERFKRTAPVLIAEEIADAAAAAYRAKKPFDLFVLEGVRELTAGFDMPDEVRAKVHKAIGQELLAGEKEGEDAQIRRVRLTSALEQLKRAQALNSRAGVTKDVERLERELKKIAPAPAGDPAPPADPGAQSAGAPG